MPSTLPYYDPYGDFSDGSDSSDEYIAHLEEQYFEEDVDIEMVDSSDAEAISMQGTRSSAPSTMSAPEAMPGSSNESSYSSYEPEPWYDDGYDEGNRYSSPSSDSSMASSTESRCQYGRSLDKECEAYRFPADDEWERQQKQHRMLIDIMGAKYPPEMAHVMQSTIPGEKKVLDLGCGNGEWIRDVARDFPLSECVAIDLMPIRDTRALPPNVRTEVDDVNLGLQHLYRKFDVVHCRLLSSGVKDYQLLIENISNILRPGGLIELAEFDFHAYTQDRTRVQVSLDEPIGPPYWARFLAHLNKAVKASGGDVDAAMHLWRWITRHPAFSDITYRDVWIPAIPGNDDMHTDKVHAMMRENISTFLRSGKPLLLRNGMSEEDFETIYENALRELHHSEVPQYTRMQCIWALKRADYVHPPEDAS